MRVGAKVDYVICVRSHTVPKFCNRALIFEHSKIICDVSERSNQAPAELESLGAVGLRVDCECAHVSERVCVFVYAMHEHVLSTLKVSVYTQYKSSIMD